MSILLKLNYLPYKINKMIILIYVRKYDHKLTKSIGFALCAYSNVSTFMYTNYFLNRWFLILYLILTIP